ncbi:hypothetical protein AB7O23_08050 [Escherichia coli]|uniref:hypothetical protein n=2 Tax=Enterobacteriaceae TaxID=543 RepID=UPI00372D7588
MKELYRISISESGEYDCLEYAHKVFGLLTNLSLQVAKQSPYKPMKQTIIHTEQGYISVPGYEI